MSDKTVFISYRRTSTGKAFAGRIHDALKRSGYDPFLDVNNLNSGNWKQRILAEVPRNAHFILVLTPGALDRCSEAGDWVRHEFRLARKSGRNIIPIFEESVDKKLFKESCPKCMNNLFDYNGLDLRHNSFDADINRLMLDFIPPHKAPSQLNSDSINSVYFQAVKEVDKEVVVKSYLQSET